MPPTEPTAANPYEPPSEPVPRDKPGRTASLSRGAAFGVLYAAMATIGLGGLIVLIRASTYHAEFLSAKWWAIVGDVVLSEGIAVVPVAFVAGVLQHAPVQRMDFIRALAISGGSLLAGLLLLGLFGIMVDGLLPNAFVEHRNTYGQRATGLSRACGAFVYVIWIYWMSQLLRKLMAESPPEP